MPTCTDAAVDTAENKKNGWLEIAERTIIIFMLSSITGWVYEFFFYLVTEHRAGNSGFFFGPYLPVYGFGALFILLFTRPFRRHPAAVFFGSIPVTGVLEYFTGLVMFRIWHERWWDYRESFLNIDGYVCLRSVLSFAVGALVLMYLLEPQVKERLSGDKRAVLRHAICIIFTLVFAADAVMTILWRMPNSVL